MELQGTTAIVTGGGRGIGRAIALALAREGCKVAVASRTTREVDSVCREMEEHGSHGGCMGLAVDLAHEEGIQRLVDETEKHLGAPGILVNNAGILVTNSVPDATADEWDRTMAVNLRAAFLLSQRVLALMKEKRRGYIINVSSPAGLNVSSRLVTYGVSKAGVVALSQALYDEAKGHGIKVSTLYPGYVNTDMIRDREDIPSTPSQWATPEDMAECVLFLLKLSDRVIVKDLMPLAFKTE
jgi:3-oxoacyl-[acyl-carrier protein] reductase